MNRHPLSQRFHDLLVEAGEMHDLKQADYGRDTDPFASVRGTEQFGIPAWCGAVIRNADKQGRLAKAVTDTVRNGAPTLKNEGVRDTLLDQAVYALIGLVLYEEWEAARAEALQPEPIRVHRLGLPETGE